MSRKTRFWAVVSGLMFVSFGLGLPFLMAPPSWSMDGFFLGFTAAICIPMLVAGAWMVLHARSAHVVLTADALEVHTPVRTRVLRRADVTGWRLWTGGEAPALWLHTGAQQRRFMLPSGLVFDDAIDEWLRGVPNLDEVEQRASERAYLAGSDLPGTEHEKLLHLEDARRKARWLGWLSLAVAAWVFVYPQPYVLALTCVAALPPLAVLIAVGGGGAYVLDGERQEVRANLLQLIVLPMIALAFRALSDVRVFDWMEVVWPIAGGTAACAVIAFVVVPTMRRTFLAAVAWILFSGVYAYGVVLLANVELNRGGTEVFATRVLAKRTGSGSSTGRFLDLAPWGPRREHEEVQVDSALYGRVAAGDSVCVATGEGALGARWYEVSPCAEARRAE